MNRNTQMMRWPRVSALALGVALAVGGLTPLSAETQQAGSQAGTGDAGGQGAPMMSGGEPRTAGAAERQQGSAGLGLPDSYRVTHWIGKAVRNADGERLGEVEELVMDDMGILRYVVMRTDEASPGGERAKDQAGGSATPGERTAEAPQGEAMAAREDDGTATDGPERWTTAEGQADDAMADESRGERMAGGQTKQGEAADAQGRLIAVPMGHFKFPLTAQDHLVFETDRQMVQHAPSFADGEWPNMGDTTWSTLVVTYWLPEDGQLAAAGQSGQGQSAQDQSMQDQSAGGQADTGAAQGRSAGRSHAQSDARSQGRDGWQQAGDAPQTAYLTQEEEELFSELDENGDGVIDAQEADDSDRLSQRFDEIDTFGNDRITRSEFAAAEFHETEGEQGDRQSSSQ